MSKRSEQRAARNKFVDEYLGAQKQVFGLLSRFVLNGRRTPSSEDRGAFQRQELLVYASGAIETTLKRIINRDNPKRTHKIPRGDEALFVRLLDSNAFDPPMGSIPDTVYKRHLAGELIDTFLDQLAPQRREWQRITNENRIIVGSENVWDKQDYFVIRLTLNTFMAAAVEELLLDKREYHDAAKQENAYSAGLRSVTEHLDRLDIRPRL